MVLRQVFLRVLLFPPLIVIPPFLRTHIHLHVALTRTKGEAWEPSKEQCLSEIGKHWIDKYFHFFLGL